jgi:hypothetical protein
MPIGLILSHGKHAKKMILLGFSNPSQKPALNG